MSKIIINWEKQQITRNNMLSNIIKLINYSKSIFLSDHKLSFAINDFITKKKIDYEIRENDLIIDYFIYNDDFFNCKEIMEIQKKFFNETIFIILKNFNSLMIGDNNYLNVYYKKNITNIFLESYPITSVFKISNLKSQPFNYSQKKINVIKQAIFFLDKKIKTNYRMIKIWNLYFFSTYEQNKAVAIDNDFLIKINKNIKNEELVTKSINYDTIIDKLLL